MRKKPSAPWTLVSLGEKIGACTAPAGECTLWVADTNIAGYPRLTEKVEGRVRQKTVQRVWWALHFGEIPKDRFLRMCCKNRACVRLSHMYLEPIRGASASARTREARALYRGQRGKLSPEDVQLIKERSLPIAFLADALGVTSQAVSLVRGGKTHGPARDRQNRPRRSASAR